MSFETALEFVLRSEGGYSNRAEDKGGATNKGITQKTYSLWLDKHGLSNIDVKDISSDDVSMIYKQNYWDSSKCNLLPDEVSIVYFDACVQHGQGRALQLLKKVVNGETVKDISLNINLDDSKIIAISLINERRKYYEEKVMKDSSQMIFLKGWMNRMDALEKILNDNDL